MCWYNNGKILFEGEILEVNTPLPKSRYRANSIVKVFDTYFSNDKAIHLILTYIVSLCNTCVSCSLNIIFQATLEHPSSW